MGAVLADNLLVFGIGLGVNVAFVVLLFWANDALREAGLAYCAAHRGCR